jgi:hypothetical protein
MNLDQLPAVGLAELEARVPMLVRDDRKYLISLADASVLVDRLGFAVLEIDGCRTHAYDTVYFDTPDRRALRDHVQRRRRRFKSRTRTYSPAGTCSFEVKLKGRRGETIKHRIPYAPADHGTLTPEAAALLAELVPGAPALQPALRVAYTRATLMGPAERITIDTAVTFAGAARLRPGWAIVETKTTSSTGAADRELRGLGARPVPVSKYVLGTGMTALDAPANDLRRLARRYFAHA